MEKNEKNILHTKTLNDCPIDIKLDPAYFC